MLAAPSLPTQAMMALPHLSRREESHSVVLHVSIEREIYTIRQWGNEEKVCDQVLEILVCKVQMYLLYIKLLNSVVLDFAIQ